jgi:hypothetical protein
VTRLNLRPWHTSAGVRSIGNGVVRGATSAARTAPAPDGTFCNGNEVGEQGRCVPPRNPSDAVQRHTECQRVHTRLLRPRGSLVIAST